jgi:glucose/arabinose dehydrogenase
MRRALIASLLFVVPLAPAPSEALPSDLDVRNVATLDFATGMQFTPSGDRLFVNERSGRVRVLVRESLVATPVATVTTSTSGEGGLLGLALHPDFERGQPWIYLFYTVPGGAFDRVIRIRISSNREVQRQTIMDNLPAGLYHHGGILAFGPDRKLYVSNGEAHDDQRAQDPNVLGGKIYRLNDDGSIPSDNPFSGKPTFAYGIRNPFGMAFDPSSGRLWETENGPSDHDEVNIIVRGGNYGWPVVKGDANDPRFIDPVRDYVRIIVPTMAAFGKAPLPAAYRGNFFFGTYGQQTIRRLVLTSSRQGVARDEVLYSSSDGVVGMTMGPDGLYFSTPSRIRKIRARAAAPSPTPPPATTKSPSPSPTPSRSASATPTASPTPSPSPSASPTPSLSPSPTPTVSPSASVTPRAAGRGGGGVPWAAVALVGGIGLALAATLLSLRLRRGP